MATFSRKAFDTVIYAAFRPTYPQHLFQYIFQHHGLSKSAKWNTALDIGCGTGLCHHFTFWPNSPLTGIYGYFYILKYEGQATTELTPFRRIVGVDPSAKMIDDARKHAASTGSINEFEFVQATAEKLPFLQDGSIDLIVSAQAAHWFDWTKFWPECARVLRPGGSAALWIYSEFRLSRYPALTPLITAYSQGSDPNTSLGPYFQRPGRTILENHLIDIPEATDVVPGTFSRFKRVFFTGDYYPDLPSPLPIILRKSMTWLDLLSYLRTWSALYTYHEINPRDMENPEGDIAIRFWKSLQSEVEKEGGVAKDEAQINLEWPLALILVSKAEEIR